jgi:hypothetical protein
MCPKASRAFLAYPCTEQLASGEVHYYRFVRQTAIFMFEEEERIIISSLLYLQTQASPLREARDGDAHCVCLPVLACLAPPPGTMSSMRSAYANGRLSFQAVHPGPRRAGSHDVHSNKCVHNSDSADDPTP